MGLFGGFKACVYKPCNALCLLHVLSKVSDVYAGFDGADFFFWGGGGGGNAHFPRRLCSD
jgi:hypothetical protein